MKGLLDQNGLTSPNIITVHTEQVIGMHEHPTKALKEKQISGAGLDVATPEPLPASDPLWTCPNLVISPHNSGQAPIRQVRLIQLIAENVRRYSNGLPLMNVVDKVKGY